MLHSERMKKLRIYSHKKYSKKLIDKLHSLGVLHIKEHKKTDELDIGSPLENGKDVAEQLVAVRSLVDYFKLKKNESKNDNNAIKGLKEIKIKVESIQAKLSSFEKQKLELKTKINAEKEVLSQLDVLSCLYLDLDSYQPLRSLSMFVGYIDYNPKIREELASITSQHKFHVSQNGKRQVTALFIPKANHDQAQELLNKYNFSEISLDKIEGMEGSAIKAAGVVRSRVNELQKEIDKINLESDKLGKQNKEFLLSSLSYLETESDKAEITTKFAQTKQVNIITGFVPRKNYEKVIDEIDKITNNTSLVQEVEFDHHEKVPVKLKHSKLVTPFQFFLDLYSLPKYKEIDPTSLIFFTFPLFFGLMLGDVVYGLITLILFTILRAKMKSQTAKMLLGVMIFASLSTIVFGFAFGEYLGFEYVGEDLGHTLTSWGLPLHEHVIEHHGVQEVVYEFPRVLNRLHGEMNVFGYNLHIVLIMGAIIGFIHLNLGIFLGFINELGHSLKHAIFGKLAWFILEAGIILAVMSMQGFITLPTWVGWSLFGLAAIMLVIGEGVIGVIEIPGLLSNMLSYLRIGAVALASVGLAVVVNEQLAMPFFAKGGVFIVFGILILIVGHLVNIGLGVIGPFLHSLRLHYVEYFTKFFHGGGVRYTPFGDNKENK